MSLAPSSLQSGFIWPCVSMSDEGSSGDIVDSPLSQNTYVLIWTLASLVSFAIFVVYF